MNGELNQNIEKSQKHLKILQEAVRAFFQFETGLEETLKIGLAALLEDIDFDSAYLFLYDESYNALVCAQASMRGKGIIAGESRIPITESDEDVVSSVFLGKTEYALWDGELKICVGLKTGDDRLGVLVADKTISKVKVTPYECEMLNDYAREFSRGIRHIKVFETNLLKIDILLALSKISEAMASAMEVDVVLSIILKSVVETLKFDRVKLYLIDEEKNVLQGQISADIRKIVTPITGEQYPLKQGVNRAVDSLFVVESEIKKSGYGAEELFYYVPLVVKKTNIGVMVVDNIFSRQPITKADKENLEILANQAAVTIEKAMLYEDVKELSIRDSLTGLYVHRYFLNELDNEIKRASRSKEDFALMIIDIDGFKAINDRYGHQVGDKVIQLLGDILLYNMRGIDIKGRPSNTIGRYGGDEFVILLPNTNAEMAKQVGSRLQKVIKERPLKTDSKEITFTISVGVAIYPDDAATQHAILNRADKALYWAKQHGKNRVCLVSEIIKQKKR